ncbi:MAG: XdhC family protein [Firmicutes bacterium]|nr:XdhC family protein [Bacillota bacterium]
MTARRDQVEALRATMASGSRAALAVVIWTDGSVYRRAGARTVVTEEGRIVGLISGGCAEQDLLEHARSVWQTGQPLRMQYDFRGPDDLLWGMGSGCNGALTVWMIPCDPGRDRDLADRLVADAGRRADTRETYVSVLVVNSADPGRLALGPIVDGEDVLRRSLGLRVSGAASAEGDLGEEETLAAGRLAPASGEPGVLLTGVVDGVQAELFVDRVAPRPQLVIVGAGEDALLLAQFAHFSDWHVTVIDHREEWLEPSRIPWADVRQLIARDHYGLLPVAADAHAVIMTHNFEFDRNVLGALLPLHLPYLALLGPRRRCERMLDELRSTRETWSDRDLGALHSPAGLDTGAETPEEIALAILAEAMACRRGRSGGELRARVGPLSAAGGLA